MDRRAAAEHLITARADSLVVTGLGSPTYDVHAAGDNERNYYLWGAMGGAALVGLGLALAQPERQITVITGDGEQLMAIGGLATIVVAKPKNLDVFVLDNERYGETGMQESHTAHGIDLAAIAKATGFADTGTMSTLDQLDHQLKLHAHATTTGPRLYVLKVDADSPPRSMPSRDAVYIKNRLRSHLGLAPN